MTCDECNKQINECAICAKDGVGRESFVCVDPVCAECIVQDDWWDE